MALTVSDKLLIAEICEYLVTIAIKKGGLYAGGIDVELPQKIYAIRITIQYQYDQDPTDDTLVSQTNYLYGMCMFNLQAQNITSGSGIVAPIVGGNAPLPLQFIVAASGNVLNNGDVSTTLTTFIGYNLLFTRGGIAQSTVTTEPTYYSWSRTTGLFTINPMAYTGELFQIYPV